LYTIQGARSSNQLYGCNDLMLNLSFSRPPWTRAYAKFAKKINAQLRPQIYSAAKPYKKLSRKNDLKVGELNPKEILIKYIEINLLYLK